MLVAAFLLQSPFAGLSNDTVCDSLTEVAVAWAIMGVGKDWGSGHSKLTLDSCGGGTEGQWNWSDPTDYAFPVPSQQLQSLRVLSGFRNPFFAQ